MIAFRGPKYQGGWIGAAITAGAAIAGSIKESKDKRDAQKAADVSTAESFRRQNYLDQQQRKWQLQDQAFKQNAIGGFRGFGQAGPTGTPVSTAGLADWNPENKPTGGGAMSFGGQVLPTVNPYAPDAPLDRPQPIGLPLLQLAGR